MGTPFTPQQLQVFDNVKQPRCYQHTPRPVSAAAMTKQDVSFVFNKFERSLSQIDTFINSLPITYDKQLTPPHQSSCSSSNVHGLEFAWRDALQMLAVDKLNGILINGTLFDLSWLLSMVTIPNITSLQKRRLIELFVRQSPNIVRVSSLFVCRLNCVNAAVDISSIDVKHPLNVGDELVYLLIIKIKVFKI